MSYYTVDHCDLSCYEAFNHIPPSLSSTIILAECFEKQRCAELSEILKNASSGASGVHDLDAGEKVDYNHRSSSYCSVDTDVYNSVADRINFVVNYHVERQIMQPHHKLVLCEGVQFLKYDASNSGHFNRHHDDGYFANGGFQYVASYRKFSTVTYINDDYEGGELTLDTVKDPQGNPFSMKMPVGTTIIFPSDQRFPHEVKKVTKGTRYSIVCWYNFE